MRAAPDRQREVFRPYRLLAVAMALAGALWCGVALLLLSFEGVPWRTWVSVLLFIAFFAVATWYYGRSAIVVEGHSFTYRGLVRTCRCGLADIRTVEVVPGIITVYAVRIPDRVLHFTSLFARHRTLAQLLVDRSGLGAASR